ncbi:MAG: AAA family ATPase [Bacilli bacterium]|nr:AAA family ATPase [Bacilli bacterium]
METTKKEYDYGIRYYVSNIRDNLYELYPIGLIKGEISYIDSQFITDSDILPILVDKHSLTDLEIVGNVYSEDDLRKLYDYQDDDLSFLENYFYSEYKDLILIIVTENDSDYFRKSEINIAPLLSRDTVISCSLNNGEPTIALNNEALNELLNADSREELIELLKRYQKFISKFKDMQKRDGVTKVSLENGKVIGVETTKKVSDMAKEIGISTLKKQLETTRDITYSGLKKAIKEEIFGHDKEIDTFAQRMYMNYTAIDGEPVESILLVGPTGTGKTETVRVACRYLNIPFFETNASNLVPQGIKGTSIEDVIVGLYEQANCDLERAERGCIFLDEFDKLNDSELEIKTAIKNILLTFTAGGTFPINNDRFYFDFNSAMAIKVYAGVFDKVNGITTTIGFSSNLEHKVILKTEEELRKSIIKNNYFSDEELSRISKILFYKELSRETRKNILLYAKSSEFAKKKARYKRQFGLELIATEDFVEEILDSIPTDTQGMRNVNNKLKSVLDEAEKALLDDEEKGHKRLVLTKETVTNPKNFDLR